MNLYRLDPDAPMDALWRKLNGERGAVSAAKARAKRLGQNVTVSKIDGRTLRVSPVRTVTPSGSVSLTT